MTISDPTPLLATHQFTDGNDPDISTRDTVKQMYQVVNEYINNEDVQIATKSALQELKPTDSSREIISKIFYWIKKEINFTVDPKNVAKLIPTAKDPNNVELLIAPDLLLQLKSGDCDCFSMLASAMLRIAGLPTRFITIATDKQFPNVFTHVYLEVYDNDHDIWLPFDCSHGSKPDWEYKDITRRYTWLD